MTYTIKQTLIIFTICVFAFVCKGENTNDNLTGTSKNTKLNRENYIKDNYYINSLKIKIAEFSADSSTTSINELISQLERKQCKIKLSTEKSKTPFNYDKMKQSVLAIGELYKCKNCPAGHISSATAFVISEDGLCVSNYHVFDVLSEQKASVMGLGAINFEGKVFKITEVLAANKINDVLIFKIDTEGRKLTPLPLNQLASIGDKVKVISHPKRKFYAYSEGIVTRKHIPSETNSPRYTISADYAQGSSGGPVFDKNGNVIGVIESTLSLYSSDNHIQMVMKDIIPIQCVLDLISE
ncbi:serine protease [Ancylomarina salipaludis]|uniref:Serine protease n=1 Tax=Ancylomarina salipaludis TaxID=2501299 RepID=A0A4Q1JKF3_9BACT|nr:serine protease [Ancylomarina salipaludis]RXQ90962.1 serine protease [Ancylomarina salipaludis]